MVTLPRSIAYPRNMPAAALGSISCKSIPTCRPTRDDRRRLFHSAPRERPSTMTSTNRRAVLALAALALLTGTASAAEAPYKPRPRGTLTFTKNVAPLLLKHCATCHRPGEV